jgi:hypothetical protein
VFLKFLINNFIVINTDNPHYLLFSLGTLSFRLVLTAVTGDIRGATL